MTKNLLAFLLLIITSTVFAGNDKGNGGDAIVCRHPNAPMSIISAEILDYYEAREFRSLNLQIDSFLSVREKVMGYARKLKEHSRGGLFADIEDEALKLIDAEEKFNLGIYNTPYVKFTRGVLVDIPDSSSISVPFRCNIEQLAIRVNKKFVDDPEYIIQLNIFSHLEKDQRAGLILHELIYRSFVTVLNHKDSVAARYFHQLLLQTSFEEFDRSMHLSYLKKVNIR